jgi:hypothetical protein
VGLVTMSERRAIRKSTSQSPTTRPESSGRLRTDDPRVQIADIYELCRARTRQGQSNQGVQSKLVSRKLPVQRINLFAALIAKHQWRIVGRQTIPPEPVSLISSQIDLS